MANWLRYGLLVCWLWGLATGATAAPYVLDAARLWLSGAPTGGRLEMLVDHSRALSIEQVASPPYAEQFQPVQQTPNLGFTRAAVWFRFSLLRPPGQSGAWWLEVRPAYLDHVQVFWETSSGFERREAGNALPFFRRALDFPTPVFLLEPPVSQAQTYLVRVESSGALYFDARLFQPDAFSDYASQAHTGWGLYAGAALALIVLTAWLWRTSRDQAYALLAIFSAMLLITRLCSDGLLQQWLLPGQPGWHNPVMGSTLALALASGVQFVNRFSGLERYLPRLTGWLTGGTWVLAGIACAAFLAGHYTEVMPIVQAHVVLCACLQLGLTGWLARRGEPQARTLLLALLLLWLVLPARVAQNFGWLGRAFDGDLAIHFSQLVCLAIMNLAGLQRYLHQRQLTDHQQAQALAASERTSQLLEHKVTERTRALQDALMRVEQALELERQTHLAQRQFVATVSHELRTPLAVIDAATQNLLLMAPERHDPSTRLRLEKIQTATDRLTTLLDEGLSSDRLGLVDQPMHPARTEVRALLEQVIDTARQLSDQHPIQLEAPASLTAWLDPELIRLALRTLVDNATKYTPPGTPILLTARTTARELLIDVSDQGPGIPEEELPHIFNAYYRGRQSVRHPGTGLGLSLTRHIIRLHGGHIAVNSSKLGTRFCITLPLEQG